MFYKKLIALINLFSCVVSVEYKSYGLAVFSFGMFITLMMTWMVDAIRAPKKKE